MEFIEEKESFIEEDRDEFNQYNREIANTLFREEEITLFKKIYNLNFFNKLKDPTTDLFKGIDITPIDDNVTLNYNNFEINEDLKFNDNNNVYTPEFKKSMIEIDNIINNEGHDDNLKYTLIGHKLQNFNCNSNYYRFRLIKHILNYCECIKINKSILLNKQQKTIRRAAELIGNCDFENLESFSIKEIEDWFRGIPNTKKEDFFEKIKKINNIGKGFINRLSNIIQRLKGNRRIDNTESVQIKEQPQQELKELKLKMDKVRMDIMSLDELNKNNFCTDFEMALTYEKYKTSEKWFSNPQLVAFTSTSASMTIQSIIKTPTISQSLTSSIHPYALATFVTTALGPLIGLFFSIGVSYFLDSKFYKDLRSTRQINLNFINWISKNEELIDILNKHSSCSYRTDPINYKERVESAHTIIKEYLDESNEIFNKHIKKLEFYLYAYYYRCKIIHQQIDQKLTRKNISDNELILLKKGGRKTRRHHKQRKTQNKRISSRK